MGQNLRYGESLLRFQLDHAADERLRFRTQFIRKCELSLQDKLVQVFKISGFERNGPAEHGEEEDTKRPYVDEEAFIAFVNDYFWSKICWSTALLLYDLTLLYYFGNAKVADLDPFLTIEKYVVELDVTMNDGPAVNVGKSVSNLLEDELSI